jgi:hypothetical protein
MATTWPKDDFLYGFYSICRELRWLFNEPKNTVRSLKRAELELVKVPGTQPSGTQM